MRRRAFLAGAAALASAGRAGAAGIMASHATPRRLPEISFIDEVGGNLTLADFAGRVVLLNVWATWCVPCREEMPTLDNLQNRLGGDEFHVLALSIDRGGLSVVRRFYDEIGIRHLGIYLSEGMRAMRELSVIGLPTTLLIDHSGREVARLVGPAEWASDAAIAQFQSTINERSK